VQHIIDTQYSQTAVCPICGYSLSKAADFYLFDEMDAGMAGVISQQISEVKCLAGHSFPIDYAKLTLVMED
jgi:hypothetical protein